MKGVPSGKTEEALRCRSCINGVIWVNVCEQAILPETSSGWPTRRIGVTPSTCASFLGSLTTGAASGVSMYHGCGSAQHVLRDHIVGPKAFAQKCLIHVMLWYNSTGSVPASRT